MQFDTRRQMVNATTDSGSSDYANREPARPTPQAVTDVAIAEVSAPFDPDARIPPDVMSLIRRIAKFHARIHEGLILFRDDMANAILHAEQSQDGMTVEEHTNANAVVERNPCWRQLLIDLMQAAADDVYEHPSDHNPEK